MAYELRPIAEDEVEAFLLATYEAFAEEPHEEDLALFRRQVEPGRTFAVFADGEIAAASGLLSFELTVPGAQVPMAGVTAVGVQAVHRRKGLLDRMMRAHLDAIHERGTEAVSALWAAEAGIYGRWGYGLASTYAELTVRSPEAALRDGPPEARPRSGSPADLLEDLRRVYDAVVPHRPGLLRRSDVRWEERLHDPEHERAGAGRVRTVVADDDGGPAGYAIFAIRKHEVDSRPNDVVEVREVIARTPAATRVLWSHLLTHALSRSVHWLGAATDEPLVHMLEDARAVTTRLGDGLYVRLVDVPRALAQRTYAAPVDVVLDVRDDVCPWNAGRWRLEGGAGGARCERTGRAPDLALSATELGAAHLGGTSLAVLGAAGRVVEHTAGALDAVSPAFAAARAPWGFEQF